MNLSRLFIQRPVATALFMLAIVLAGLLGLRMLPIAALPQVDYPTIQVQTLYPGASPDVMSRTVTAPLERQFGQMSGLERMGSVSGAGVSVGTLQFALNLGMDTAEQEVQQKVLAILGALTRVGPGRAVGPGLRSVQTPQGFNRASAVSYTQFRSRLPTAMTVTTRMWSST